MTNVCVGVLLDEISMAFQPDQHRHAWATPAGGVRTEQPDLIVDRDHNGVPVGRVVHLERSDTGDLWAVAELDDAPGVFVRVGDDRLRRVPCADRSLAGDR